MNDQSQATLPDLRYFRYMDCDEPYTCREILKKHLRTKHPGQSDTTTPSGIIKPEWIPQAEMLPSPLLRVISFRSPL
ncbi:hypothetical protein GJ496_007909 [Pomphorhynchus laevis]|nr:hypothetical protein GJ496_007909 [Pomphorhynchus laevis]